MAPPIAATCCFFSQLVSLDERFRRISRLVQLHTKKVLVVGGGSLGGTVALELAKAGTGLINLVDQDRYEVNNGAVTFSILITRAFTRQPQSRSRADVPILSPKSGHTTSC